MMSLSTHDLKMTMLLGYLSKHLKYKNSTKKHTYNIVS